MRIGISCYPTYGGSGVVATELGKNLARMGHEIHFMAYAMPYRLNEYYDRIYYHEVKVMDYPLFEFPPYSLALATKMAEIARYQSLDLVHVHYAIPHAISAYLARQMVANDHSLKIITTLHGTDITLVGKDPSFLEVTRFGIEESDGVTSVSQYLKDKTIESFHTSNPIRVIYNFIEEHPDQQKSHLSNFRPVKRVVDAIEVAYRVLQKGPVKLMMIGDGPERSLAESRARELNISQHVHFLGKQENVFLLLSSSDVFLMPSQLESFGLAALEAMACGVPVVASHVGGLTELVREGVSGFTAPVGDVEKMTELVLRIFDNDDSGSQKMSRETREYAFDNFHVNKIIPQYVELYENLLS
ncbi:MAG: N-acetyl-alpha-D-glucosaminyl L-malate synthase BshA [Calditrichia bacterium]